MIYSGKVVVVGGGSQGAGFAIACSLAQKGVKKIILLARRKNVLDQAVHDINSLVQNDISVGISVDLSDFRAVQAVAAEIKENYGVPNIIVNSSASGRFSSIDELDETEPVSSMSSTYFATINLIRVFIHELIVQNSGQIIVVGSPVRLTPLPSVTYTSSRFALYGFVEALRIDLKETQIKILYVEPSRIIEGHYFQNNPGVISRLPFFVRDLKFKFLHQNLEEVGNMVTKSIERGDNYSAHWTVKFVKVLVWLGLIFLINWIYEFKAVKPEDGGYFRGTFRIENAKKQLIMAHSKKNQEKKEI